MCVHDFVYMLGLVVFCVTEWSCIVLSTMTSCVD